MKFAIELLREAAQDGKSVLLSPPSVSTALFALYLAADGKTKQQLKIVLGKNASGSKIRLYFAKFLSNLDGKVNENYTLEASNRFCIRQELLVKKNFNTFLQLYWGDELFKFHHPNNKLALIQVPMIETTNVFPYYDGSSVEVVKLPYINCEIEMVIIRPKIRFGLSKILKKLNTHNLLKYIAEATPRRVALRIPKFRLKGKLTLVEILKKIGVTDAFSGKASFKQLTDISVLVDNILHASFIEVNEKGTEIAASTITLFADSIQPKFTPFITDGPFLFLIVKNSKSVLFAGQYAN
uniref:Serpin domain-containing protein n=1 Tax=Setaria digitata TaxID=48799 RepID=A0A915PLW1_9BILA